MDLSKIIIKNVIANKTESLVKSLEELPQEVINKNTGVIEAYHCPLDESVELNVVVDNLDEAKKVIFQVPKEAFNIKKEEFQVGFNYKGRHYYLEVKYK